VLLFSGFAVLGIILATKERDPRWLGALLFTVKAYQAWQSLRLRIWRPVREVTPLEVDF
jgi:hypothetical protein